MICNLKLIITNTPMSVIRVIEYIIEVKIGKNSGN